AGTATFKWSFDNGAVAFPIESFGGESVQLTTLGRDDRLTLEPGDWVELEDDRRVLHGTAEPLFQVAAVDRQDLTATLDRVVPAVPPADHPRLRRWDQKDTRSRPLRPDGTVLIVEATDDESHWLPL